jgi:hypothetical protein
MRCWPSEKASCWHGPRRNGSGWQQGQSGPTAAIARPATSGAQAQAGMLVQIDGSRRRWLGAQGPWWSPLAGIDDATGTITASCFREQEDGAGYLGRWSPRWDDCWPVITTGRHLRAFAQGSRNAETISPNTQGDRFTGQQHGNCSGVAHGERVATLRVLTDLAFSSTHPWAGGEKRRQRAMGRHIGRSMAQKPDSVDRVDPRDLAIRLATVVCLILGCSSHWCV